MAGKIIIDIQRCKGCGLCVGACPKNCIAVSEHANSMGYFPAQVANSGCTGCAMCALICPEVAIEVLRESTITAQPSRKKGKSELIGGKS